MGLECCSKVGAQAGWQATVGDLGKFCQKLWFADCVVILRAIIITERTFGQRPEEMEELRPQGSQKPSQEMAPGG